MRATIYTTLFVAAWLLPGRAAPREVTAAQILRHAEQHAPEMQVAAARRALGDAAFQRAAALLPQDPELSLTAGPRLVGPDVSVDWEVSLEQRLEIAGERGLRREAARRLRARLGAEARQVGWRVHQQVHRAFHLALLARRRLAVQRQLQVFADRLLLLAERRQAAGDIAELQLSLVRGEAALSRQARERAAGAYRAACRDLGRIAGWPAGATPPSPSGRLEPPRPLPRARHMVDRVIARHPELTALRAAIAQARAERALASRERAPKPVLGIAVGREAEGAGDAATLVLGTVSLPLPLWRRNRGPRADARARLRVARARARAARQALRARLEQALERLDSAARRAAIFGDEVLPSLGRNLGLLRRAFEEGKIDATQVMVARGRLLATQVQALEALQDYYEARAELELALGQEIPGEDREVHHD